MSCFNTLSLKGDVAVEVELVDYTIIQQLNADTRGKDAPTDVLSFPFLNFEPTSLPLAFTKQSYPLDFDEKLNAVFLGSIVICPEVAIAQASEYGHSEDRELSYLFIHGLLHLFGYDHETEKDKKVMRALEEKIL